MKTYKKHIDAFIRDKAGRDAENPPSHIWEQLDKQLDGLAPSKPPVAYRWLRNFAFLSLILLLSVFTVKKISGNAHLENNNIAAADTKHSASVSGNSVPTQNTQKTTAQAAQNPGNNENTQAAPTGNSTTANNTQPANNLNATNNPTPQNTPAVNNDKNANKVSDNKSATNSTNKSTTPKYANKDIDKHITPKNKHNPSAKTHNTKTPADEHNYAGSMNSIDNNTTAENLPATQQTIGNTSANTSTANNTKTATPPAKDQWAANTKPKPAPATTKKETVNNAIAKKHKKISQPHQRWEEGIKAGYESGFNSYAASKLAVSPYIQYNISAKVSILVQPTIKYAALAAQKVGSATSYYQVNDDGTIAQNGNSVLQSGNYVTNYTFRGTHDSIVKSYAAKGAYLEAELPILLKYYVSKKISVFGGINLLYSQVPRIIENTYTQSGIVKTMNFTDVTSTPPSSLPALPDISYSGISITNYTHPLYQSPSTGVFHIGYMVGFSYQCSKRWLFDALIEQSPVKPDVIGGYNVNTALSAPYFRLSAGYKLKKNKNKDSIFGKKDTGRGD